MGWGINSSLTHFWRKKSWHLFSVSHVHAMKIRCFYTWTLLLNVIANFRDGYRGYPFKLNKPKLGNPRASPGCGLWGWVNCWMIRSRFRKIVLSDTKQIIIPLPPEKKITFYTCPRNFTVASHQRTHTCLSCLTRGLWMGRWDDSAGKGIGC